MRERKVLLLSQGYMPVSVITWRRAVSLVLARKKAEVITEYSVKESSVLNPAVVRLLVKSPDIYSTKKSRFQERFSKKNVLIRDNYSCAYCTKKCTLKEATIDHVLPRSRGGKDTYTNCVTCCKKCNSFKDNRTPEEAGMTLKMKDRNVVIHGYIYVSHIPSEWNDFVSYALKTNE